MADTFTCSAGSMDMKTWYYPSHWVNSPSFNGQFKSMWSGGQESSWNHTESIKCNRTRPHPLVDTFTWSVGSMDMKTGYYPSTKFYSQFKSMWSGGQKSYWIDKVHSGGNFTTIDYIITNKPASDLLIAAKVDPDHSLNASDHLPLTVSLVLMLKVERHLTSNNQLEQGHLYWPLH